MSTLAREIRFAGRGIHTGADASVRVLPSDGGGIAFLTTDGARSITEAGRQESARNTTLRFSDGTSVMTVEHLLSALVGMGVDDAVIEIDGPEAPILDGSAMPYVEAIAAAGLTGPRREACSRVVVPIVVDAYASMIQAIPSDDLRITYVVDYPGTAIGTVMKSVVITPETYSRELAPARTFALFSEVEAMRSSGLAMGGSLENALVVGPHGPMDGRPLRVDAEYAAHKAMDLLGDLALLGEIPTAHYLCIRGGHALHARLVSKLRHLCVKHK